MKEKLVLAVCSFVFMVFAVSCSTKVAKIDNVQMTAKLQGNQVIFIAKTTDGTFDGRVYNGSGASVQNNFMANIRIHASKVITGSQDDFMGEAKQAKAYYIVKPTILYWEPRNAAWSGIPTKVEINVIVYDAAGKELVNRNLTVRGRSMTFTSQSAEGLANHLIQEFCREVF
ncbi:MAG: DUF4823 domain-containing protein [Elusimicrobiota bacterium]|jgi:hypothetical protein|nr:DUF4823 domain-containing protein [Elusimicrobiota bacterium]